MINLTVQIELKGNQVYVGNITGNDTNDACFTYADSYIENVDSRPVSISLPLEQVHFSPLETRNFFEGLLPEGFTRRCVAQWMHAEENENGWKNDK